MKPNRRELTRLAMGGALGLLAGCGREAEAPRASRPPNIVFIMLDDLGYGDFGCYGQKMIQTPNVDAFAAGSLRFTDCYAGGAVCAPSRSCLMTGYHMGHTSIRSNAGTAPILPGDITVGEVLQAAGYKTGVFGKWGLGDAHTAGVPNEQGFDESFGYLHQIHAHSYYPEFLWRNGEKVELPENRDGGRVKYSADLIFEESLQFIRNNRQQPFFLYGAYTLPHGRYEIPSNELYADRDWPEDKKNYAAMVSHADAQIGRLLALLKELEIEEETIVFVTSDNGGTESMAPFFQGNGPLRGFKGELYEGGIRVPMIVRWPGKTDPGTVSSVPWYFPDFLPTAAELAGGEAPAGIDGVSVVPALIGSRQPPHEFMYWEFHNFSRRLGDLDPKTMQQAVRMGNWKAVKPAPEAAIELYNLETDIAETKDVAATQAEVMAKITVYMKEARSDPRPQVGGTFEFATE